MSFLLDRQDSLGVQLFRVIDFDFQIIDGAISSRGFFSTQSIDGPSTRDGAYPGRELFRILDTPKVFPSFDKRFLGDVFAEGKIPTGAVSDP